MIRPVGERSHRKIRKSAGWKHAGFFYGKNLPFLRLSLFCFITISQMHYSIYYFSLNFSKKYRLPINIDIFYIGSRYFYFIQFFSLYNLILRYKYREGIG